MSSIVRLMNCNTISAESVVAGTALKLYFLDKSLGERAENWDSPRSEQRIAKPISAGLISTRLPGTALFRADWLQAEDHASPLKATLKISM